MIASVTLSYHGRSYTFEREGREVKGRLACDCEKSRLIQQSSDPDFPLLGCGTEIDLLSFADAANLPEGPRGTRLKPLL